MKSKIYFVFKKKTNISKDNPQQQSQWSDSKNPGEYNQQEGSNKPTNEQEWPQGSEPGNKSVQILPAVRQNEREKRENGLRILRMLLTESASLSAHIKDLLSHKSSEGATPFMYAVSIRAYEAANLIYEAAVSSQPHLAQHSEAPSQFYGRDLNLTYMLFPVHSRLDQSPLYTLCSNDTCSFTWTGDQHITQDIFECRTCTLVGHLCCCTECARTCHKGHDCKIKTSLSPTAYCDCWEKCKCKALIAGDQTARLRLFDTLLAQTNFLSVSTVRSEHLIIYLIQTLSRQVHEQKNFKRLSGMKNFINIINNTINNLENLNLRTFNNTLL